MRPRFWRPRRNKWRQLKRPKATVTTVVPSYRRRLPAVAAAAAAAGPCPQDHPILREATAPRRGRLLPLRPIRDVAEGEVDDAVLPVLLLLLPSRPPVMTTMTRATEAETIVVVVAADDAVDLYQWILLVVRDVVVPHANVHKVHRGNTRTNVDAGVPV